MATVLEATLLPSRIFVCCFPARKYPIGGGVGGGWESDRIKFPVDMCVMSVSDFTSAFSTFVYFYDHWGRKLRNINIKMKGLTLHNSLSKAYFLPWPPWLSWLSVVLQSKSSSVWFPVRAHAWVAAGGGKVGRVLVGALVRGTRSMYLSHFNISLPLFSPSLPLSKSK